MYFLIFKITIDFNCKQKKKALVVIEVTWDRNWVMQVNIICKLIPCLCNMADNKSLNKHILIKFKYVSV